jgi:hypothetical protein
VQISAPDIVASLGPIESSGEATVSVIGVPRSAGKAIVGAEVLASGTATRPASHAVVSLRSTVAPPATGAACARLVSLDIFAAPDQQSYRLEWTADPGRIYWIEYGDSLGYWQLVPDSITATSGLENWIDPGPPATSTAPATATQRFYRLWEMPPP